MGVRLEACALVFAHFCGVICQRSDSGKVVLWVSVGSSDDSGASGASM